MTEQLHLNGNQKSLFRLSPHELPKEGILIDGDTEKVPPVRIAQGTGQITV
jgi:hypothetical protein